MQCANVRIATTLADKELSEQESMDVIKVLCLYMLTTRGPVTANVVDMVEQIGKNELICKVTHEGLLMACSGIREKKDDGRSA